MDNQISCRVYHVFNNKSKNHFLTRSLVQSPSILALSLPFPGWAVHGRGVDCSAVDLDWSSIGCGLGSIGRFRRPFGWSLVYTCGMASTRHDYRATSHSYSSYYKLIYFDQINTISIYVSRCLVFHRVVHRVNVYDGQRECLAG